ncbi:TPA: prepilin-type cleavage/methylation domain-containing protein, partial [Pseudomonas aeruginosa]|nr:prepilin-type cleavage/methylation domain-containing protein [Pseudomonas aeruginosa]
NRTADGVWACKSTQDPMFTPKGCDN